MSAIIDQACRNSNVDEADGVNRMHSRRQIGRHGQEDSCGAERIDDRHERGDGEDGGTGDRGEFRHNVSHVP
jgi:hypothetical protein